MTTDPATPHREPDPELPAGLASDLRALYRTPVPARAGADEAILALARERAAMASRQSRSVVRIGRWVAAAAAVVVGGAFLAVHLAHPNSPTALAGDVNGDGRVDILDALVLARDVRVVAANGQAPAARRPRPSFEKYDLNHDGTIDERDVDLIAVQAVRLTTPERKS